MDAPFPMHPSYEERAGVPDRSFPRVSPAQGAHMVAAWARLFAGSAGMRRARVLHLHHLTPMHEAAALVLRGRADRDAPARHRAQAARQDRARRARRGAGEHARLVGRAHARGGAPRDRDDRDLAASARRGRAPARARPGDRAPAPRRRRRRPLRGAAHRRRRAPRALARLARARSAGLGRGELHAGQHPLRARTRCSRRSSTADSGEPRPVLLYVGRFLGVQARAAARARLRACARAHGRAGAARDLGRRAGRVGGRASAHRRHARGRRRHLLRRLARACRPAARARLRRLLRRAVDGRAVRARLPRGDGLRAARDRHAQRRPAELHQRRARRAGRLARAPPTTRTRSQMRSLRAVDDPAERSARGENAARHVRDSYSWNGLAGRFTQLYEQVTAAHKH